MLWTPNAESNQQAVLFLGLAVVLVVYYLHFMQSEGASDYSDTSGSGLRHNTYRTDGYGTAGNVVSDSNNVNLMHAKGYEGMTEAPSFWNPGSYQDSRDAVDANVKAADGFNNNLFNEGMRLPQPYEGASEWDQSNQPVY